MEAHLDDEQRKGGNKRNGKGRKTIKSSAGSFETDVQSCIVHQIRNSLKYVASKDQKEFTGDLKRVW